jgi:hypothetical protein
MVELLIFLPIIVVVWFAVLVAAAFLLSIAWRAIREIPPWK